MARDRLGELRVPGSLRNSGAAPLCPPNGQLSILAPGCGRRKEGFHVGDVHQDLRDTETEPFFSKIEFIESLQRRMSELHVEQLVGSSRKTQNRLTNVLDEVRKESHSCKQIIDNYDQETKAMTGAGKIYGSEARMRENVSCYMYDQLLNVTRDIWDAQRAHKEKLVAMTARRVKVRFSAFGEVPGNGCDGLAKTSVSMEDSEALLIARRLVETGNEDQLFSLARDELEKALRTRDAVLELERDMEDLYQLFYDLSILVRQQHDELDKVKENEGEEGRRRWCGRCEAVEWEEGDLSHAESQLVGAPRLASCALISHRDIQASYVMERAEESWEALASTLPPHPAAAGSSGFEGVANGAVDGCGDVGPVIPRLQSIAEGRNNAFLAPPPRVLLDGRSPRIRSPSSLSVERHVLRFSSNASCASVSPRPVPGHRSPSEELGRSLADSPPKPSELRVRLADRMFALRLAQEEKLKRFYASPVTPGEAPAEQPVLLPSVDQTAWTTRKAQPIPKLVIRDAAKDGVHVEDEANRISSLASRAGGEPLVGPSAAACEGDMGPSRPHSTPCHAKPRPRPEVKHQKSPHPKPKDIDVGAGPCSQVTSELCGGTLELMAGRLARSGEVGPGDTQQAHRSDTNDWGGYGQLQHGGAAGSSPNPQCRCPGVCRKGPVAITCGRALGERLLTSVSSRQFPSETDAVASIPLWSALRDAARCCSLGFAAVAEVWGSVPVESVVQGDRTAGGSGAARVLFYTSPALTPPPLGVGEHDCVHQGAAGDASGCVDAMDAREQPPDPSGTGMHQEESVESLLVGAYRLIQCVQHLHGQGEVAVKSRPPPQFALGPSSGPSAGAATSSLEARTCDGKGPDGSGGGAALDYIIIDTEVVAAGASSHAHDWLGRSERRAAPVVAHLFTPPTPVAGEGEVSQRSENDDRNAGHMNARRTPMERMTLTLRSASPSSAGGGHLTGSPRRCVASATPPPPRWWIGTATDGSPVSLITLVREKV